MRFYDPIIGIVNENISDNVRDMVNLKNQVAFEKFTSHNFVNNFLSFIGATNDKGKEKLMQNY